MLIKNEAVVVYDIEIFPNCFHCCCKDTETQELYKFEISTRKNQLTMLIDFFVSKGTMFCGYNNHHYDDVIINYIIDFRDEMMNLHWYRICDSLYNLSNTIINSEEGDIDKFKRWKYAHYFHSMDLLTMQFSSKLRVGLKEMQVTMLYENVQEYDGDFNKPIPEDSIDEMIAYNINDVNSTESLLTKLKPDIELRLFIEEEYGIECLSMDSVKFGETLLLKKYCEATHLNAQYVKTLRSPMDYIPLKDVILPYISYTNPTLQSVLEDMKKQVVYSKERKGYEKQFVLDNVTYSVGVGGIHSIHSPKIFKPKEGEIIMHSDVTSMYPSLIIKYGWIPRHLRKELHTEYSNIYQERVEAKHTGQKLKNLALKLTLNSVTGKMQQETSWMYDPFSVFKIRINGQLILLMLVDRLLQLGCKIVQVNTDGVVYITTEAKKGLVLNAITEVEELTRLTFETDMYKAFYQYAINDYFGILEDDSVEEKGMFITTTKLGKGLSPVVIPKAIINYFLTKEPVSSYIKRQTDIKDFLMAQRVDKKFKIEYNNKYIQRINRYYASTNGCYLYKVKDEGGDKQYFNMLTKSGVTILNTFDDTPIEDRHINYNYYISEANKIIEELSYQQLELF